MRFKASDLKLLKEMVSCATAQDWTDVSRWLRRRQPDFCDNADDVGIDPRCHEAYRFCILFCSFALEHAERTIGFEIPAFSKLTVLEAKHMARTGDRSKQGKRARILCGLLKRHVLQKTIFDDDDRLWLQTAVSGFLFCVERSI